jgi:hypothetical protein
MAAILAFVDRTLKPIDRANQGSKIVGYGQSIHQTLFGFYDQRESEAVKNLIKKMAPKEVADDPVKFKAWSETDGLARVPTMMIAKNILSPECFGKLDGVFRFFLKHEQELKKAIEEQCIEKNASADFERSLFNRNDLYEFLVKNQKFRSDGDLSGLSGSTLSQFQGRPKSEACSAMARRLKAFQAMLDYEIKRSAPGLLDVWTKFRAQFQKDKQGSH